MFKKPSTDAFQRCNNIEKLKANELKMEEDRAGHRKERNRIYKTISGAPQDLNIICDYLDYLRDDEITLDFDRWIRNHDCELLKEFKEIVPVKEI